MSNQTPIFDITYPSQGQADYYADLSAFFTGVETTIGQNCHLILEGDDSEGATVAGELGFIASATTVQDASTVSRWGRVVLQANMVDGDDVLTRLLGISAITGASGALGDPIFHSSLGAEVVVDAEDAVVDGTNRIVFLSLGMCLGSGTALFNGLLPISTCPIVLGGELFAHPDGSSNPSATGIAIASDGSIVHWAALFDGATQDNDALFPFVVPADFGSFPDKAGAAFWGFRTRFRRHNNSATGYAGGQIVGFVDSVGTEFTSLGTAMELANVWTDQTVLWATLAVLGAVITPGRMCFLRIKLRGNNTDVVDFETPVMQYMPAVLWN